MIEFFDEDSALVAQQVFLIKNNEATMDDVPPLYNLREVVEDVLSKDDSMVTKNNFDTMEGGN